MNIVNSIYIHVGLKDDIFSILKAFVKYIEDINGYLISMSNPSTYGYIDRYIDMSTNIFICKVELEFSVISSSASTFCFNT